LANRVDQHPEGIRTSSRTETAWRLVRDVFVLLLVWMVAVYMLSRTEGSVAVASVTVAIGCLVALLAGFGIESIVMRKAATLWIGCIVLAVWASLLPFIDPGTNTLLLGLGGLAIVAATPGAWRKRNEERQRAFIAQHKMWGLWRVRLRKLLVGGIVVGLATAILTGLWNSVLGA
jgi:hypothetical protein